MTSTQQDPLARLPAEDIAPAILQEAGLHTRLVCRNYLGLHPQLTALAPHGLHTPGALMTALASLPSSLTSLDLRHVRTDWLTPGCMAAMAAAAPSLEELKLGRVHSHLVPALLDAVRACTKLHTISHDFSSFYNADDRGWACGLLQPSIAGRLRALSLPRFTHALGANTFPHLTALELYSDSGLRKMPAGPAPALSSLAAAAPALQRLKLNWLTSGQQHLHHLTTLTRLTTLVVSFERGPSSGRETAVYTTPGLDSAPLLRDLGCLTNLRNLQLHNFCATSTPTAAGWPSRLTQLSHLRLGNFFLKPHPEECAVAATSEAVAAAAQQLPALHALTLHEPDDTLHESNHYLRHPAFFHHLALATRLQQLSFDLLGACPSEAQALSSLQGLTTLEVKRCAACNQPHQPGEAQPIGARLQWVSSLTNLQQLTVTMYDSNDSRQDKLSVLLRGQVLEPLLHLHTLKLCACVDFDSPPFAVVEELLAAVEGRLERLQLQLWDFGGAPLPPASSLLVGLTRLQVLDVRGCVTNRTAQQPLPQLPHSLRRCYLPEKVKHAQLQQLQAVYPLVAFRQHQRRYDDGDQWWCTWQYEELC